jgi:hypothetical protein
MDPRDWSRIQQGIFAGESGGDYGALFGYQNRPNGRFSGVDLTKMTVDQALDFANPSGPYGQYVKGQVGRVATPMGAYQIVGTTLRAAKEGLGLRGDEVLTPAMQDKLGQWIYKTQGTGAWEGYKPMTEGQAIAAETMSLLGKGPQTSTKGPQMMQEQKPQGLLGSLGIQKRDEAAGGETAQPFYQRDSFKDTAAVLAQGFGRMGIMGMEEIADDIAKQRTEAKAKNKTMEALGKMNTPQAQAAVEYINAGGDAVSALKMAFTPAKDDSTALMKNYDFFVSKGMSPEQAMTAVKSGNTINTGDALKVLSDGRVLVLDPKAQDGYRVITPPGSKAATEAAQSEAKEESRESSGSIMGQNVIQTAARVRELISPFSVGYGSLLKTLPESDARELQKEVDALGAIASSENLNLMRQESPTGGALGNVSDRDIQLLKDKSGAIDPGSKPEVFRDQVDEYELFLLQTIHGEKAGRQIFDQTRPPPVAEASQGTQRGSTRTTTSGVTYKVLD